MSPTCNGCSQRAQKQSESDATSLCCLYAHRPPLSPCVGSFSSVICKFASFPRSYPPSLPNTADPSPLSHARSDDGKPIYDPYYGIGGSGFQSTYEQCVRYSRAFLEKELGLKVPQHVASQL